MWMTASRLKTKGFTINCPEKYLRQGICVTGSVREAVRRRYTFNNTVKKEYEKLPHAGTE
ncbi:hypothetical protein FACS1894181_09990 [Bacteroidia bacterium]|nr:hypothetical protein FACS1894181_09990 [Bacteroidia bacterium]